MSCECVKLRRCEISGSTFEDRKFNFTNRNISNDVFTAKIKRFDVLLITIKGIKSGSKVNFSFTEIENYNKGNYLIEYWANFHELANERIATEELIIK